MRKEKRAQAARKQKAQGNFKMRKKGGVGFCWLFVG